jgi:hypothetical protein
LRGKEQQQNRFSAHSREVERKVLDASQLVTSIDLFGNEEPPTSG